MTISRHDPAIDSKCTSAIPIRICVTVHQHYTLYSRSKKEPGVCRKRRCCVNATATRSSNVLCAFSTPTCYNERFRSARESPRPSLAAQLSVVDARASQPRPTLNIISSRAVESDVFFFHKKRRSLFVSAPTRAISRGESRERSNFRWSYLLFDRFHS